MWITVYTDASWKPNQNIGGWGMWARSDFGLIKKKGRFPKWVKCSNTGEMTAVFLAVKEIAAIWTKHNIDGILVCTDSATAISYLKFDKDFKKENYNRKDWLFIREKLYQILDSHSIKIKFRHVKGHQSSSTKQGWLNNMVDGFSREI